LVPKSDLGFAGPITKIEYQASVNTSNAAFRNFEMKLCHTPLAVLGVNFAQNYGGRTPVVVAAANPLTLNTAAGQWFPINFTTPFNYNNSENVIIEVRWQNPAVGTAVDVWGYDCGADRLLVYKDYNAEEGTLSSKVDRFRITWDDTGFEPASLSRIKTVFR